MNVGTMEIGRPRVRNLDERFISKVLPMFKRQTEAVRALIPELYLHGLASGILHWHSANCWRKEPLYSASSLQRLKEKWQGEYEQWKSTAIEEKEWSYYWADGIYVKTGIGKRKRRSACKRMGKSGF